MTNTIITVLVLLMALGARAASQPEKHPANPTVYIEPKAFKGLGRTFDKLTRWKHLTIGYLGGSITAGSGASNPETKSWRALTTKWFRDEFPNADIREINAAIGGTNSTLGAFRMERDLLSGRPDLVFIEFAVNDNGRNKEMVDRSIEGIVRHILAARPYTDIVMIYAVENPIMVPAYQSGKTPESVVAHQRVAEHYGLPSINVGRVLLDKIDAGEATWGDLAPDKCHPSDTGYALYADVIKSFLQKHRDDKPFQTDRALPEPLNPNPFDRCKMIEAQSLDAPGWTKMDSLMPERFSRVIASDKAGTELVFPFSGSMVGAYLLSTQDGGDFEWSIDGGKTERTSTWTSNPTIAHDVLLGDNLAPGSHVLRIKVLGEKQPDSKGTWVRIGAMVIDYNSGR